MGAVGSKVQRATAEIERVFSPSERNRATRRNQARENRRARWSSRKRGAYKAVGNLGKGAYNAVGRVGKFAKNVGMGIFDVGRRVVKGVSRRAGNVVNYARKGTVRSYANRLHSAQSRAARRRAKARVSELMKEESAERKRAMNPFYDVSVPRSARSASARSASAKSARSASARSASAKSASTRRREFNALFGNLPRSARRVSVRAISPGELRRRRLAHFAPAAATQRSSASRRVSRLNPDAPAFVPAGTRSVRAGRLNLQSPSGKV
jgi:hypothetical protein